MANDTTKDIKILREWLAKMPHIIQDYDDEFLEAFLKGCKGSLQKTKTVLENFNAIGMRYPALFGSLDPLQPRLQELIDSAYALTLPKKLSGDILVSLSTFNPNNKTDPHKLHTLELFRYWLLWFYVLLWENEHGDGKWVVIIDCSNFSLGHFKDFTPVLVKNLIGILVSAVPVRVQAVHLIKVPSFLEWLLNLFKSLAPKKLGDRMNFHISVDTLYPHVSKKILPREYGGEDEDLATLNANWRKKIESYRDRFLQEETKMRKLDSIRPKMEESNDLAATFKSLNID